MPATLTQIQHDSGQRLALRAMIETETKRLSFDRTLDEDAIVEHVELALDAAFDTDCFLYASDSNGIREWVHELLRSYR